ncbi:Protein of unknown function [Aquimarina amphilecti]|uniref:DUF4199 domain-containing protein n=1 Tax=Aquimarina amphilecti TaxID=1038014 RepID=A0A1H7QA35_AQUAM|nr:DUF4199 domain-containing protein [Aquimarina amphilecti]SEL44970.1 Protein of unknown function [Aquimarina amphilecti]
MKSKSIPIKKYILKYGVIFGIISVIFSLTTYLRGNYTNQGLFHLILLSFITIGSIMTGLLVFKSKNNNFISLLEALKIGVGISILGGILLTSWEVLLIHYIDPEIITQLEDAQIKKVAESSANFTQEEIEKKIKMTQRNTSAMSWILLGFIEDLIVGFLISLVSGLIIRKKRDPFK